VLSLVPSREPELRGDPGTEAFSQPQSFLLSVGWLVAREERRQGKVRVNEAVLVHQGARLVEGACHGMAREQRKRD